MVWEFSGTIKSLKNIFFLNDIYWNQTRPKPARGYKRRYTDVDQKSAIALILK